MTTHEYERPWQVMPAKIIKLALEHAEKVNDFDHQVAYLLLDIGVEAALKTYLLNRKHDVEKMVFPELLRKVKEELQKTNPDFIRQIDDVGYFHGIRNKLYHQGDGVKPTEDNLKRYSDVARKIIEEVIEVTLETEERKFTVEIDGARREFEELIKIIEKRFKYFQESCGIIAEKALPAFGTREFAMKLRLIWHDAPDIEEDDPEERIKNRKYRVEKFNELTRKEYESHEFVDYLLKDINHFYVIIALQQMSENWTDDWNEYIDFDDQRPTLLHNWKYGLQSGHLTDEQIREEFEKIVSWLETQEKTADGWIDSHMENIYREIMDPPLDFLDFRGLFG